MKTSSEGIRLNKSFEGYHRRLENGDCTAYQTLLGGGKLDRPTCGYGTTKGVTMGMVWTEVYATQRMMEDLAEAEFYVAQYVKVAINQNEHDALVLFTNNCGPGNLQKLCRSLNKGDRHGTATRLLSFNRAQGIIEPGLVSRRHREAALFLKPVEAPAEPAMPQTVQKSLEPPSGVTIATATTAATGGIYTYFHQFLDAIGMGDPSVPDGWQTQAYGLMSNPTVKSMGSQLWTLPLQHPALLAACAAAGLVLWLRLRAAQ